MEHLYEQPLSMLCANLLTGYNVKNIQMNYRCRPEVATRIWITLEITFHDEKTFYLDGSSPGIAKRRLIELLEKIMAENNRE